MSDRKYRAQILLEPEQHIILTEMARQRGQSISHLVREIVAEYALAHEEALRAQLDAYEQFKRRRAELIANQHAIPPETDVAQLIQTMREERDHDIADATANRR